jgi:hypothetical protein
MQPWLYGRLSSEWVLASAGILRILKIAHFCGGIESGVLRQLEDFPVLSW